MLFSPSISCNADELVDLVFEHLADLVLGFVIVELDPALACLFFQVKIIDDKRPYALQLPLGQFVVPSVDFEDADTSAKSTAACQSVLVGSCGQLQLTWACPLPC